MSANFDALLFDLDGTLIDSERLYFAHIKKKIRLLGKEVTDALLMGQIGKDLRTTAPDAVKFLGLDMSVDAYIAHLDIPSMFKDLSSLELMPGVSQSLEAFGGRLPMAIASGSLKEFISLVLDKFKLHSYFRAFVSASEVPRGKPAPDVFLEAAKRLGVPIERCIVIDDAPAGVQSGKNAGAYTIAAASHWTKGFDFEGADYLCHSMDEARRHIEGIL